MDADVIRIGSADDTWSGLFLRRHGQAQKRAQHHGIFRLLHGAGIHPVGAHRVFAVVQRRPCGHHRQPALVRHAGDGKRHGPGRLCAHHGLLRHFPDDVRHHHARPHHRRGGGADALFGAVRLHRGLVGHRILSAGTYGLGRRIFAETRRHRFCGRRCGAYQLRRERAHRRVGSGQTQKPRPGGLPPA